MDEVSTIGDEMKSFGKDTISSFVESEQEIKQTLNDTKSELKNASNEISNTVRQTTTLPVGSRSND